MSCSRRHILATSAAAGSALALGGCERLISKATQKLGEDVPDSVAVATGRQIDPIHHLLSRAGFGPWPGELEHVRQLGITNWIDQQLHPESIDDAACDLRADRFRTLFEVPGACFEYKKPYLRVEMARHTLLRAVYSKRQLFEAMVGFWTDHLNIDIDKGACIYFKPWDDAQVIRQHALGKFRDLIRASALSPAMLVYLDGDQNVRAKPSDVPNENYARELMELHTLGVHGGYTQQDVSEVARCLTGWRVRMKFRRGTVYLDPARHDDAGKRVLGRHIPAGQGAKDLDEVIDIVCRHPSTSRHIATKLVRRFVAEDPPAALVDRVAEVFRSSDGDIRQTARAVLVSDEFTGARGVKFKPPFRFVASALRAMGADTHAHPPLIEYLSRMGQGVFQYPTPDGYPDKASPWLGTLLWRWNLAFALAADEVPSVHVPLQKLASAIEMKEASNGSELFEHCVGRAPTEEETSALREDTQSGGGLNRTRQLAGLVLASPAFQRY